MQKFENTIFIFDVDSTLVRTETLDDIIEIAIDDESRYGKKLNKQSMIESVKEITDLGMNGKINFEESLTRRCDTVQILQTHLDFYNNEILPKHIDFNFKNIIKSIQDAGGSVFIVSGGFIDSVSIIACELGVTEESTFANEFIKDNDCVVGFDRDNHLINSDGKVQITKKIKSKYPNKKVICIGDGNSDYLIKKNGIADEFWGFWGNVQRESLIKKANRNFYNSETLLEFVRD